MLQRKVYHNVTFSPMKEGSQKCESSFFVNNIELRSFLEKTEFSQATLACEDKGR